MSVIPQMIANLGTDSEGFENAFNRYSAYAVTVPASMEGASIAWERGLRSGGPWTPVVDEAGAAITFVISTATRTHAMGAEISAALRPAPFLRLVAAAQTGAAALEVDAV